MAESRCGQISLVTFLRQSHDHAYAEAHLGPSGICGLYHSRFPSRYQCCAMALWSATKS